MQGTMNLPAQFAVPMPAGRLDTYIPTVNRFPLLTHAQAQHQARRYRHSEAPGTARHVGWSCVRLGLAGRAGEGCGRGGGSDRARGGRATL